MSATLDVNAFYVTFLALMGWAAWAARAVADDVLYRYDGEVPPYDTSAGWLIGDACEDSCVDEVTEGAFILNWKSAGDRAVYWYNLPQSPPALWVEWRFRSNHPIGPFFVSCDAAFYVRFRSVHQWLDMYGDAVISFSGSHFVTGLALDEYHTYRFESNDGLHHRVSVDGRVFLDGLNPISIGTDGLGIIGTGGCTGDQIPNMRNHWDFIRYGTMSSGENIAATDPPQGFLDAREHVGFDRILITFDQPAYAYIDDITVSSDFPPAPQVIATQRRDNGEPDELEVVLDRPIPLHGTTQLFIDTGAPRHRMVT